MIRNFDLFCNLNRIKLSELALFSAAVDSLSPALLTCPFCGATHSCSLHGHYNRDMIVLLDGLVCVHSLRVPRVFCTSCTHTHAFLPAALIPHASYSLFFILQVLRLYFLHAYTVNSLCLRFSISVSTLYAWIHLFRMQKGIWLGVLKHCSISSLKFLALLSHYDFFLQQFFGKAAVSFLQPFRITSHSGLP